MIAVIDIMLKGIARDSVKSVRIPRTWVHFHARSCSGRSNNRIWSLRALVLRAHCVEYAEEAANAQFIQWFVGISDVSVKSAN